MVRNCLKTLDSGFCRNDGKWYFLTFYEIINFESFIKNNSKYSSKTIQIIAGLNSYNIILYPRYRWDYIIQKKEVFGKMDNFGQHLMIDGYSSDSNKLKDIEFIYNFLDTFPDRISMTKIMPPYVFKYIGKKPEDWGLSGVVLIAESHISIHTFPSKQFLSIDIFSCKKFDSKDSICFVEDIFDLKKIEVNLLDRGLEFPKDIRLATDIVYKERLNPAG